LLVPLTVALNCCVVPWGIVIIPGITDTLVTVGAAAGAGAGTVTVAVPLLEVSAVDVALTVRGPGV